ncbi:ATP-binding protein [Pandoraea anhela]|uniref:ATP-binding protein n=1 Tax=Pandoraea anhela TaxID=2508295 RepID=UPI00158251AB|nr:ATP-binding protein [Pandoraea anhela]
MTEPLLLASALCLSALMLVCAAGVSYLLVSHQKQEYLQTFAARRESLKTEVDMQEASVRQLVSTFEFAHWNWQFSPYAGSAAQTGHWLEEPPWLPLQNGQTTAPYSILLSADQHDDPHELQDLLELTGVMSTSRVLRDAAATDALRGFVYSPSGRFLGSSPSVMPAPLDAGPPRNVSIVQYIKDRSAPIEQRLGNLTDDEMIHKVFWLTVARDPLSDLTTTYVAAPVFEHGRRLATIVLTIPCEKFSHNFLQGDVDPNFFVVTCRNNRFLGIDSSDPYQAKWIRVFERYPELHLASGNKTQTFWRDGIFLITQRVPGPDWIAVYAYTWQDLLLGVRTELFWLMLATTLGLGLVWIGAVWLRNRVVRPASEQVKRLAESEAFSRSVLDVAPVSLAVVDRSTGEVLMQNTEAQELSVLAASRLNDGVTPSAFLAQVGQRVNAHARGEAAAGDIGRFEMAPELDVAYASAQYKGQEVFVIGLVNLAQQKDIERTLLDSRRRAEEANNAKSVFVATISHEIRTPLHGALGNLELLGMSTLSRGQRGYLEVAMDSFKTLLSLINDVLDFSKLSDAEFALRNVDTRVDESLELTVRTLFPIARAKGVRLLCLIAPQARGVWHVDPVRVSQVMMNLTSNAVKFTDHGTVTVALSVDDADRLLLRVADTGRGIPESEIDRIFMPFVQGGAAHRQGGGTGLGLALCEKIVAHMGGEIAVQSECGVGTLFSVSLPAPKVGGDAAPGISPAPEHIAIRCEHPLWATSLREQFRAWFPGAVVRLDESARFGDAFAGLPRGEKTLCVMVAMSVDDVPDGASDTQRSLLIALDAPFTPTWRGSRLQVSAYSGRAWLDGVAEILLESARPLAGHARPGAEAWRGRDLTALVVEDDGVSARLLRDQLQIVGISVVDLADSAEQAMSMVSRRQYDMVVTDSNLPGMSGMSLCEQLRAMGMRIPMLLCSADVTVASGAEAVFDGVLIKPISMSEIRSMLSRFFPEMPLTPRAERETEIDTPSAKLRSLFLEQWFEDRALIDMAVERGDTARIAGLLHRVRGGLLILDETATVASLDALSASVDDSGMAYDRHAYFRFMRDMDLLVRRFAPASAGAPEH